MQDFDAAMMKDMAKLKNANEADALLRDMKGGAPKEEEIKNEYKAIKEVEELKKMVEKQSFIIHAFWIMLQEKGATNEDLDKALNEAVLLSRRTDYKHSTACPNCGKPLQAIENRPYTSKCFYCGVEQVNNPFKKYDGLDPYSTFYAEKNDEEPEPYISDDEADEKEFKEATDVISQSFEPYDVTKDLGFDEET
ncbi:MAG: hypothetical protein IKZ94_01645 [Lachnospiraceae bacterium]|nr:hypothetical protein [Lachnospiraceae bacterium]